LESEDAEDDDEASEELDEKSEEILEEASCGRLLNLKKIRMKLQKKFLELKKKMMLESLKKLLDLKKRWWRRKQHCYANRQHSIPSDTTWYDDEDEKGMSLSPILAIATGILIILLLQVLPKSREGLTIVPFREDIKSFETTVHELFGKDMTIASIISLL
jgi:hypothetical protein